MTKRFYNSFNATAVLPLVVRTDWDWDVPPVRRYHLWFFGYVAKLPYEWEEPMIPQAIPPEFELFDLLENARHS